MSGDDKRYIFDEPSNVRRVIRGLVAVCLLLVGLDFVIHRHVSHPWEGMFGFYAVYGFVGCVVLVLLAKGLRRIVMRTEDYYDPATGYPSDEEEDGDA
jgi:hypothetical protein